MIYKKYKENNFEGVKDMQALMKSLSSGLVGRKQKAKDKEKLPDLYLWHDNILGEKWIL